MSRALVLSGGGSLGAVQVGMLRAVVESGLTFDHLVGTSVGAINAAWTATHPGPDGVEGLVDIWRGLRRQDVFPAQPWHGLLVASGRRSSLVPSSGLSALLRTHLGDRRIEDASTPLHVVVVDAETGSSHRLSEGSMVDGILASTAIPGVLPPVEIDGRTYLDGGVVDNCPVRHAIELGADELWVLPAGYQCSMPALPTTVLGMALHGLTLLVAHGLTQDLERFRAQVRLHVAPPLCPLRVSPADFSQSAALMDRSYRSTTEWLAAGAPPIPLAYAHPHPHAR